jgi:hypothetical protein
MTITRIVLLLLSTCRTRQGQIDMHERPPPIRHEPSRRKRDSRGATAKSAPPADKRSYRGAVSVTGQRSFFLELNGTVFAATERSVAEHIR